MYMTHETIGGHTPESEALRRAPELLLSHAETDSVLAAAATNKGEIPLVEYGGIVQHPTLLEADERVVMVALGILGYEEPAITKPTPMMIRKEKGISGPWSGASWESGAYLLSSHDIYTHLEQGETVAGLVLAARYIEHLKPKRPLPVRVALAPARRLLDDFISAIPPTEEDHILNSHLRELLLKKEGVQWQRDFIRKSDGPIFLARAVELATRIDDDNRYLLARLMREFEASWDRSYGGPANYPRPVTSLHQKLIVERRKQQDTITERESARLRRRGISEADIAVTVERLMRRYEPDLYLRVAEWYVESRNDERRAIERAKVRERQKARQDELELVQRREAESEGSWSYNRALLRAIPMLDEEITQILLDPSSGKTEAIRNLMILKERADIGNREACDLYETLWPIVVPSLVQSLDRKYTLAPPLIPAPEELLFAFEFLLTAKRGTAADAAAMAMLPYIEDAAYKRHKLPEIVEGYKGKDVGDTRDYHRLLYKPADRRAIVASYAYEVLNIGLHERLDTSHDWRITRVLHHIEQRRGRWLRRVTEQAGNDLVSTFLPLSNQLTYVKVTEQRARTERRLRTVRELGRTLLPSGIRSMQ
jgi:hypothetical protein